MTQAKAIELIFKSVPYPHQIQDVEFVSDREVRFSWRNHRYSLSHDPVIHVNECEDSFITGSDLAIMMGELLKMGKIINGIED